MSKNLNQATIKVFKVIESCTNEDHLKGAFRLLHNFARLFSTPAGKKFGEQLWHFEDGAAEAYNELWLICKEKETKLRYEISR
jgi:hypothetical protein